MRKRADDEEWRPEAGVRSPEELERMKEATEETRNLIHSLRGKPWPMKKKLLSLR